MKTIKLVTQEVQEKFVDLIISYAVENGMTLGNIIDSLPDVVQAYLDNAQLEKECKQHEYL